jgi:CheY-like chemotaxis protein
VIRVETRRTDGFVTVKIEDTGEGMMDEVKERCLEPFFSTKGTTRSGMGLTAALAAAGRYGGTLALESTATEGTTVTLRLRVFEVRGAVGPKEVQVAKAAERLRVLIIDDEPWERELLAKSLRTEGHETDTAGNGQEGLEKSASADFDVVLLDRAMPDMSGDEVARRMKKEKPDLPIVLVTGFGDIMLKEHERLAGVDLVLGKPVTIADLLKAIGQATGKKPAGA